MAALASESVAALNRNQWPFWIGISGRFASECAPPKRGAVIVIPKRNRSTHGKPPVVCHVESYFAPFGNPLNESRSPRRGINRNSPCTRFWRGTGNDLMAIQGSTRDRPPIPTASDHFERTRSTPLGDPNAGYSPAVIPQNVDSHGVSGIWALDR